MDTAEHDADNRSLAARTVGPLASFGLASILRVCVVRMHAGLCDFDSSYLYEGYIKYLFVLRHLTPTGSFASLVHALVASTVAPLTFLIGRHLKLSEQVAWTAGLGAAVLPYYVSTVTLQPQVALTLVLASLSTLIFVVWRNRSYDIGSGCLYALIWSYFCYCRPNALLLLAFTFAIYLTEKFIFRPRIGMPAQWKPPLVVAGIIILCFNAMAFENYGIYQRYRPLPPNFGYNLYVGNNQHVRSDLARTDLESLETGAMERQEVPSLDHYSFEADEKLGHTAEQFIVSHPLETLQNSAIKAEQYWSLRLRKAEPVSSRKNALYVLPYLVYGPLALVGVYLLTARKRYFALMVTLGSTMVYWAPHAVFFSTIRFRMPTEYLILILAAEGAWYLLTERWSRQGVLPRYAHSFDR